MDDWLPEGFTELERLGDGSFGRVELIQRESDGVLLALKVLEKQQGIKSAEIEIEALNAIDSPFVVKLYDVYRYTSSIAMLIDADLGGSLRQKIAECKENSKIMEENEILYIAAQIFMALKEIHKAGYVHRDIGPANILYVNQKQEDIPMIQIIDFGVSASCKNGMASGSAGTPSYMSPEVSKGLPHNTKADMYSAGAVLYEMCELKLPQQSMEFINHPEFEELITSLLSRNPDNRPSAEECLQRPEFAKPLQIFKNAKRQVLTSHDWNPVTIEFDDVDLDFKLDFEDLPPVELEYSLPRTPGGRLLSGRKKKRYEPDFEGIQNAERVAMEQKEKNQQILQERKEEQQKILAQQKEQEKSKQLKWNEQKDDLSKHQSSYKSRIRKAQSAKRDRLINVNNIQNQSQSARVVSADDLEKTRIVLEKKMGIKKLSEAYHKLEDDPLLSPSELGITPQEYDAVARLVRRDKEFFG